MEAILGKITGVVARGGDRFAISLTPACLLPERAAAPEWLRGAVLTVEREAPDQRELGGPGDSFVLTPDESARWLQPLTVTPEISYGKIPPKLEIRLAWWPVDPPPGVTVRVGRRRVEAIFARREGGYTAEVETDGLFSPRCKLPAAITVEFSGMAIHGAVLPIDEPFVTRLYLPGREIIRLENGWYGIDVVRRAGGAILAWREHGREIDHFAHPANRIGSELDMAGHRDRLREHWTTRERLAKAVPGSVRTWREEHLSRLRMKGRVDKILNTRVECALYDELPILLWRRIFETREFPSPKAGNPREPIDSVRSYGISMRGAWPAERGGDSGSRILCAFADQLVSLRDTQPGRRECCPDWRVEYGWMLVEHPDRRACGLYLFPPLPAPAMIFSTGTTNLILEPEWPMLPARAGDSFELPLALTMGECCGAAPAGAWVGCRTELPNGIRCAAIARLRDEKEGSAVFILGGERREVALQRRQLPDIGAVAWAVADFAGSGMDDPLEIAVAGIPQRRPA